MRGVVASVLLVKQVNQARIISSALIPISARNRSHLVSSVSLLLLFRGGGHNGWRGDVRITC